MVALAYNNSINEILDSEEFNQLFDIESEQKELQESGWTYQKISAFAKSISEKI